MSNSNSNGVLFAQKRVFILSNNKKITVDLGKKLLILLDGEILKELSAQDAIKLTPWHNDLFGAKDQKDFKFKAGDLDVAVRIKMGSLTSDGGFGVDVFENGKIVNGSDSDSSKLKSDRLGIFKFLIIFYFLSAIVSFWGTVNYEGYIRLLLALIHIYLYVMAKRQKIWPIAVAALIFFLDSSLWFFGAVRAEASTAFITSAAMFRLILLTYLVKGLSFFNKKYFSIEKVIAVVVVLIFATLIIGLVYQLASGQLVESISR